MVIPIYLSSLEENAGKTLLSIAMMQKLQKENKKVGYFKPVSILKGVLSSKMDSDVNLIKNKILQIDYPLNIISPVSLPRNYYVELIDENFRNKSLEEIQGAYNTISQDVEFIIIEGSPCIKRYSMGLDDISIAKSLGIKEMVFISTGSTDICLDDLQFARKHFNLQDLTMKGVIFNNIDSIYVDRINELMESHIKNYNIPIIGIIERLTEFFLATVSEVKAAIGGELINESASSALNNLVESYIIGAMNTQAAMKYLRLVKKAAVITGGDRTDLIMETLNLDISCLILTGSIQPDVNVLTAANEKNIPLILSPTDTYNTIKNVERFKPVIHEDEINKVLDLYEDKVNWELLINKS